MVKQGFDPDLLVQFTGGYVIHAVGEGAVCTHVVNNRFGRDYDPVAALFDAFHVAVERVLRQGPSVAFDQDCLPKASEVRRTRRKWLSATGEDRRAAFRRAIHRRVYGPRGYRRW